MNEVAGTLDVLEHEGYPHLDNGQTSRQKAVSDVLAGMLGKGARTAAANAGDPCEPANDNDMPRLGECMASNEATSLAEVGAGELAEIVSRVNVDDASVSSDRAEHPHIDGRQTPRQEGVSSDTTSEGKEIEDATTIAVTSSPDQATIQETCLGESTSNEDQAGVLLIAKDDTDGTSAASDQAGAAEDNRPVVTESCPSSSATRAAQCPKMPTGLPPAGFVFDTDEGLALAEALNEARAALDHARQVVSSPSLDRVSAACDMQPEVYPQIMQEPQDVVEKTSTRPSKQHVNALHARFGQNAARARVARQSGQEREQSKDRRMDVQQRRQRDAEEADKSEPMRQRAALRAASERRIRREEQRQQQEEEELMRAKHAANAEASGRYRSCAARRARSEQQRRRALAQEVLADLETVQRARLEEDECRGDELQRRCEASDWSTCAPMVNTRAIRKPGSGYTPTGWKVVNR